MFKFFQKNNSYILGMKNLDPNPDPNPDPEPDRDPDLNLYWPKILDPVPDPYWDQYGAETVENAQVYAMKIGIVTLDQPNMNPDSFIS